PPVRRTGDTGAARSRKGEINGDNDSAQALGERHHPLRAGGRGIHCGQHVRHPGATGTGRMPEEEARAYRSADVLYTVCSYATPIAWLTAAGWVVPDVRYSV